MNKPGFTIAQTREFFDTIEQLKLVERRNRVVDRSRFENSAEHSWNAALMAHVLGAFAPEGTDMHRAVLMLLLHDLGEIKVGDTWAYAEGANDEKLLQAEQDAVNEMFATLPNAVGDEFVQLYDEFIERTTPTARFAKAIDALQPLHNHIVSGGYDPDEPRPDREQVLAQKYLIREASAELWDYALELIDENVTTETFEQ